MASGAQSVSGINPTRTRVCSGLSEPPAQAVHHARQQHRAAQRGPCLQQAPPGN
ncbi:hypothetical protein BN427_1917 [Klebsiella pneumoniae subsp. pneumoniae ST258-K28BO]|nr:hypothetical protein BN427_1917 [Klebsiella pneumoniae subsp. pneumoniae ST258-K28BO]